MTAIDLATTAVRDANRQLQSAADGRFEMLNPRGAHALACGVSAPLDVHVAGHVGYYCGGMNQHAAISVAGNAGVGVGENMMSGRLHVRGDASQSAGATGHGGLLVIDGNASARCGIAMKGIDIVVGGSVGHNSAFMAQAGHLVVCGDAEDGLGDSIYEAVIFVAGAVGALGADCVEKEMTADHLARLTELLAAAGSGQDPARFRRYGSARQLYNFKVDNLSAY